MPDGRDENDPGRDDTRRGEHNELARRFDTDTESILEARQLKTAHRAASLDVPLADDSDLTLSETIATNDDDYQRAEDTADLDRLLAALPDRERTLLGLRFEEDMTQREISQRVGVRCATHATSRTDVAVQPPPRARCDASWTSRQPSWVPMLGRVVAAYGLAAAA